MSETYTITINSILAYPCLINANAFILLFMNINLAFMYPQHSMIFFYAVCVPGFKHQNCKYMELSPLLHVLSQSCNLTGKVGHSHLVCIAFQI